MDFSNGCNPKVDFKGGESYFLDLKLFGLSYRVESMYVGYRKVKHFF